MFHQNYFLTNKIVPIETVYSEMCGAGETGGLFSLTVENKYCLMTRAHQANA